MVSLLRAGAAWAIRRSSSCEDMLSAGATVSEKTDAAAAVGTSVVEGAGSW
jgi:hypothetical protein